MNERAERLVGSYIEVKGFVLERGFEAELDWQESVHEMNFSETDLLREGAWVILSSGMNERVIRNKFSALTQAFHHWSRAEKIILNRESCRRRALKLFRHQRKIDAILDLADRIYLHGFDGIRKRIIEEGAAYLKSFEYIGPVTCFHLAKNLGIPVAKPDRHLSRIASLSGFSSVQDLCVEVSNLTGDSVSVVDLVLWRFATLEPDYQNWFSVRFA